MRKYDKFGADLGAALVYRLVAAGIILATNEKKYSPIQLGAALVQPWCGFGADGAGFQAKKGATL